MIYFAKIDNDNKVVQITVMKEEYKHTAIEWLSSNLGGKWIESKKNNEAKINSVYNEELDAFINPKPYNSWVLNLNTFNWDPPISHPMDDSYRWNEEELKWELKVPCEDC
jgi:hypothetical protein